MSKPEMRGCKGLLDLIKKNNSAILTLGENEVVKGNKLNSHELSGPAMKVLARWG